MDSLKRRNSPKTPKLEKFDAEILPSHYVGGEVEGSFRGLGESHAPAQQSHLVRVAGWHTVDGACSVQQSGAWPASRTLDECPILDRIRAAGGVAFMARDPRDMLRELQPTKDTTT